MKSEQKYQHGEDPIEQLGRRVREGDREAYREVFQALHAPLVRFARGITADEELAYDVLQDIFMKLWEKRESIVAHTSLKSMLYTMVRNGALNAKRNQHRKKKVPVETMSLQQDEEPTSDNLIEAMELHQRIQKWIDDLPERRAEAFRLSRFAGLSHREISLIMDVSERTVGTHILLALRYLRSRLDELEQRTITVL